MPSDSGQLTVDFPSGGIKFTAPFSILIFGIETFFVKCTPWELRANKEKEMPEET